MKKASVKKLDDDLRPEYDLSQLKGGVRGKYYRQVAEVFRNPESVNHTTWGGRPRPRRTPRSG